jgi:hypothetical protein
MTEAEKVIAQGVAREVSGIIEGRGSEDRKMLRILELLKAFKKDATADTLRAFWAAVPPDHRGVTRKLYDLLAIEERRRA